MTATSPLRSFTAAQNKSIPYSWRVAILPFIEQNDLYKQYNFDEPWDGPNNRKLIDKMPPIYSYPGPTGGASSRTEASYSVLTGETTAFGAAARGKEPAGTFVADVRDGMSNTIMVVEAKRQVPWTKPEDIPFEPNAPLPELGGFSPDFFNAAFADGSVRSIAKTIDPTVLRALITRAGGEVISLDGLMRGRCRQRGADRCPTRQVFDNSIGYQAGSPRFAELTRPALRAVACRKIP